MDGVTTARLTRDRVAAFRDFCRRHWGREHPLIHNDRMFEYYYADADGGLNFLVAENARGGIEGVCGYIKANRGPAPDIWISYILTRKGAPAGLGFRLIEDVRSFTGCRTVGCNNIRKNVSGLYTFLGLQVADMTQYYRLNSDKEEYTLCNISARKIPSVLEEGALEFRRITREAQLEEFDFEAFSENQPYKDRHYFQKRYLDNPWLQYEVYAAAGDAADGALLVVRAFRQQGAVALRVVDFFGQRRRLAGCGVYLDQLIRARGADFCDWFALGVDEASMAAAGFVPLRGDDANIVPLYLDPPRMENVTITSVAPNKDYWMFRADGDQDRPNLG